MLSPYRKELRKNQTEVEKIVWSRIRSRQICNSRFVRQYSVGPYILDFYCPKQRLAIELDGSQHGEEKNMEYDKDRNEYLKGVGIKTLRFWNNEVFNNLNSVLDRIYDEIQER